MLKKLAKNKKGFTLMEILVAVSILGIIVGPLLISLFSNNHVIEQARKQTEATYVARKVMEETIADYYSSISTKHAEGATENGFPIYISKLNDLLKKNSAENSYSSSDNYESRYADDFTYDIKIVPSGKIGMGGAGSDDNDRTANYIHFYRDTINGAEYNYAVSSDGKLFKYNMSTGVTENIYSITKNNSSCKFSIDGGTVFSNAQLNSSKKDFRISLFSSIDATKRSIKFDSSTTWPNASERYLANYTSYSDSTKTTVTSNTTFIPADNVDNFYSSNREQWDIALYEISVSVYDGDELLSSVSGVLEVRIFPEI